MVPRYGILNNSILMFVVFPFLEYYNIMYLIFNIHPNMLIEYTKCYRTNFHIYSDSIFPKPFPNIKYKRYTLFVMFNTFFFLFAMDATYQMTSKYLNIMYILF